MLESSWSSCRVFTWHACWCDGKNGCPSGVKVIGSQYSGDRVRSAHIAIRVKRTIVILVVYCFLGVEVQLVVKGNAGDCSLCVFEFDAGRVCGDRDGGFFVGLFNSEFGVAFHFCSFDVPDDEVTFGGRFFICCACFRRHACGVCATSVIRICPTGCSLAAFVTGRFVIVCNFVSVNVIGVFGYRTD